MNILIAGIPEKTKNYESMLTRLSVPFTVGLAPALAKRSDGLLLPGGGDIDPARFGQARTGARDVDPELDAAQLSLLSYFVREGKPVLGICRGLQLINVGFGGDLIKELPTARTHAWDGSDQLHPAISRPGSVCHQLFGPCCLVNSAHHQGAGRLGEGLTVTQRAPDGVVEALEHTKRPILAVQWHPERMGRIPVRPGLADGDRLISFFLSLTRR